MIGAFVDEIVGHEVLHRRKQDVACGGHSFPHSKGDRRTIAPGGAGCQWTASRSLRALPSVSSLLSWWVLVRAKAVMPRSEEHTSELQSLMRISYAVFCLKKKNHRKTFNTTLQSCRIHGYRIAHIKRKSYHPRHQ